MDDVQDPASYQRDDTHDLEGATGADGLTSLRLALARNGYRPVPIAGPYMRVKAPGKQPVMSDWREICANANETVIGSWSDHLSLLSNDGPLC
jgi:putative DNA primase/helicase